ncbi:MAG TPA: hypothetical protein VMH78_08095 [Thermoplasmata archaeon]|nr:hypothetical protein [Thermoplasmata archaeon]
MAALLAWAPGPPPATSAASPAARTTVSIAPSAPTSLSLGPYNFTVRVPWLTSQTNVSFALDGTPYATVGGTPVVLANLSGGLHRITNITAGPAAPGWAYFGFADQGASFEVPAVRSTNLTFAYVNESAPLGVASFNESRIPTGTPWAIKFNGTVYSSETAWINITGLRNGYYNVRAVNETSDHGTTLWVAPAFTPPTLVQTGAAHHLSVPYSVLFAFSLFGSQNGTALVTYGTVTLTAPQTLWLQYGVGLTINAKANPGYHFVSWAGSGAGSYSGISPRYTLTMFGPITEAASIVPPAPVSALHFDESGIPAGTPWTVFVNGQGFESVQNVVVVPQLPNCTTVNGSGPSYTVVIPYEYANTSAPEAGARFVPGAYPDVVACGSVTLVAFTAEFLVTELETSGGTVTMTAGSGAATAWVDNGSTVTFTATPDAGYRFVGWNGTGLGPTNRSLATTTATVRAPLELVADFAPELPPGPTVFSLTVLRNASFAAGTAWSVVLGNSTYTSSTSSLSIDAVPPGFYPLSVPTAFAPGGQIEYMAEGPPSSVNISANDSFPLDFETFVWLEVASVGSGAVAPASEWVRNGSSVALTATPSGGASLTGWIGSGSGSYTGTASTATVTLTGPISEVATFSAATANSDFWKSPLAEGGLVVAGALVGLLLGVWLLWRPPPPPRPVAPWTEEAPPAGEDNEPDPSATEET